MLGRFVVSALAALMLCVAAPAAHAATVSLIDPRGDVHRPSAEGYERVEGERRTDIVRTTIRHKKHAVVARIKLLDLRREPGLMVMAMRMRTNDGTYREAGVEASRRIGWRGRSDVEARNGRAVDCAALQHEIDYRTDVIALRVPRSCLNRPRWVQATVIQFWLGSRQMLIDNPHNSRGGFNVWTRRLHRG